MYKKINTIEFELSTTCNSFCPTCVRFTTDGYKVQRNPLLKYNENITVENFRKVISDPALSDTALIELIGTAGEPIAHPEFFDILKSILEIKPHCTVQIHTNGGLRNTAFFTKLAALLNKFTKYKMVFSIDGLEDTNHLYRKEVKWSKVMENLQAFISAGGKARWKSVVFNWNKHQLKDMEQLSIDMGCQYFETEENYVPSLDEPECDISAYVIDRETSLTSEQLLDSRKLMGLPNYEKIDAWCTSVNNIFVAPDGQVYPCCMFSAARYCDSEYDYYHNVYKDTDPKDFNINYNSLSDIINNPWWDQLIGNLDTNPCELCIINCGI